MNDMPLRNRRTLIVDILWGCLVYGAALTILAWLASYTP